MNYRTLIIVPAYNEDAIIGQVIDNILTEAPFADIVVVNDGSTDLTTEKAESRGVTVIELPYNMGIGASVQTGYKYAFENDYDVAIQADGDGQHPAQKIEDLVKELESGNTDLVIGSRYLNSNEKETSITRSFAKWLLAKVVTLLCGKKITDSSSGFRAANRRVIKLFSHMYPRDYPEPETVAFLVRSGYEVKEIPVRMNTRITGESSITLLKGIIYIIKVMLALIIDKFKATILIEERE
tara:strand:- start:701 stop:1420 length:720 start_codon:yes stop_codon:yes gene_type:complete